MIWIIALILILIVSLTYLLQFLPHPWKQRSSSLPCPPGPKGFPILGSLHKLGSLPHRALHALSQTYGPIMYLRLGLVPTVVVSSPQAAELFLKTHDLVFASRPRHEAIKYLCWDHKCLSFSPYGTYWRTMRKICTLEMLSNLKINSFKDMRKEELDLLIKSIKEAASKGDTVDVTVKSSTLNADMSCRMIFGRKYSDNEKGFMSMIHKAMQLIGTPYVGDYIPFVNALGFQGFTRRLKKIRKFYDEFFDRIIDDHAMSDADKKKKKQAKDFVDILLDVAAEEDQDSDHCIGRSHIKATLSDMLSASLDTSATAIDWTLSELMKNPKVMKKLQKELEIVVGMERKVDESDLEKLEYLDMVVKESLRLHPVAPLLLPRESLEDCEVGGFFIPKKCRVIVNAYAIMRDPSGWREADKFWPERFEGSNIDVKGRYYQMIPFGAGRRGCPGIQMGLTVVRLVVAQIVHCFDWKLPDGMVPDEMDMTEELGLTTTRAKHLLAIPTYRLYIDQDTL